MNTSCEGRRSAQTQTRYVEELRSEVWTEVLTWNVMASAICFWQIFPGLLGTRQTYNVGIALPDIHPTVFLHGLPCLPITQTLPSARHRRALQASLIREGAPPWPANQRQFLLSPFLAFYPGFSWKILFFYPVCHLYTCSYSFVFLYQS